MAPCRASVLVAVAVAGLAAAAVASAAGLGVVAARLTSASAASTVSASTCSLGAPSGDAYVDGTVLQTNTNFGSSTDLRVRSSLLGDRRSFLGFDLASCGIPATARVTAATLGMYLSQAPGSSRTYQMRAVSAAWVESTVTWSNQPAVAGAATASTATGTTSGVTLTWAVTSDVQAFVAGSATNNGWRVADTAEGALSAVEGIFGSRERALASQRPTLVVTYYP